MKELIAVTVYVLFGSSSAPSEDQLSVKLQLGTEQETQPRGDGLMPQYL